MPVSSEISVTGPYFPNGSTTGFPFDFKATAANEVVAMDQSGATISPALYSVTLDADEGGELTFSVAPQAVDYPQIFVVSNPSLTQPSDFDNTGPSFNPAAVTRAFDRAATRDLKQQREIDRSLKVPFGEVGLEVGSIVGANGKVLGIVDGKLVPIPNEIAEIGQIGAEAAAARDLAEAAGSLATARAAAALNAQNGSELAKEAAEAALAKTISAGFVHDFYPGEARDYVPRGAIGHGAITSGAGGANGTFALAFTDGDFDVNPTGTFTVVGGAVTAIAITGPGLYIGNAAPTAPALSFAASAGLTGAAASLTVGYLVGGGEFYYTPSLDDGFVSQFQNVTNVATLIAEHFDPLSVAGAVATAVREFPDYRETFGSLEFTAGAFISAPGNAFGTNDSPTVDGYLREFTVTREDAGTYRMFLVSTSAAVTWSQVFTAFAGGDDTHELIDIPMTAGSRLLCENLTGDGILWENVGEEAYFPVATWSGVIGDAVTLVTDNPVSVCLSYKVSYTPSTVKIAEIDTRLAVLSEVREGTRDNRLAEVEGEIAGMDLTTSGFFYSNGYGEAISDTRTIAATTGAEQRFDTLYFDALAGTFGLETGEERGLVADTGGLNDAPEFILPRASASHLPVFNIHVTSADIRIVPRWNIFDGQDRGLAAWLELERNRSRGCLRRVRQMINRLEPLRIVSLTDSIGAFQIDLPGVDAPNGPLRDRAAWNGAGNNYLREGIAADLVDDIPLYTAAQLGRTPDAEGAVYTRFGWTWEIIAALAGTDYDGSLNPLPGGVGYTVGSDLFFDNFGRGGQVSGGVCTGDDLQPWGANAIALAPNLVLYHFGMNELGDTATLANALGAIRAFRAAGAEVIVMGVPRPRTLSIPNWIFTNACLELAAIEGGAAFAPTLPIADDRSLGVLGMTGDDVCTGNGINHPGISENEVYGREPIRLLLD